MVFVPASRVILMRQNAKSVQAIEGIDYPTGTPTPAPSPPVINMVAGNDVINASEAASAITGTSAAYATIKLTLGTGNIRTIVASSGGLWAYTLVSADITAMGQGAETISATAALGGTPSTATTRAITIDTIAPTITSVALSGAGATNDFLNVGDTATATVTLDSVVTVTGTPQMALNVGGVTRQANYLSGPGSNTLLFRYSIQSGDTDANGISIGANSFALNGGTIVDTAGNAAVLTHGALADNGSWKVDTTAPVPPTIALGAGVADGATHAEATAGTGVITVSAETGSTVSVTFTRGSNSVVKTITGTGAPVAVVLTTGDLATLGDGTISISAPATDLAGNTSAAATASFVLLADAVPQVILVRNDALSRFDIDNAASFPAGTWSWRDDAGTIISVTTPYLLYSALPAGRLVKARANGNAATDSDLWAVPQNTTVWNESFASISNGTDFSGRASWVGPTNKFKFNSGKLRCEAALGYPNLWFTRDMAEASYSIEGDFDFNASGTGNPTDQSRFRWLYVNYTDESNWVALVIQGNGYQFQKRVAGTVTDLTTFTAITNSGSVNFKFETRVVGGVNYVRGFRNNVRIDPDGPGIAATGLTLTRRIALRFSSATDASNPSYPYSVASSLKLSATPAVGVTLADVNFIEPTNVVLPSIELIGTTTLTAFQAILFSTDGEQYGEINSFTGVTPGNYTRTIPTPSAAMGKNPYIRLRETANPANYIDYQLGAVPYFDAVDPLVFGINMGGSPAYSRSDVVKDRGYVISWRYRGPSGLMNIPDSDKNADGWPINVAMPAGYNTERVAIIFENPPAGIRTGAWDVTANVATPGGIQHNSLQNFTPSNVTTTSVRLTTIDPAVSQKAWVLFPASVIPPADGLKVSCILASETVDTNSVTPKLAEIWSNTVFNSDWISVRTMKVTGPSNPPTTTPAPFVVEFAGRKEWAADATKRLGAHIHWCLPWASVADRITIDVDPYTTHFLANAKAGALLGGTVGNEVWEDGNNTQQHFMAARGFTEQLVPAAGVPAGKVVTNEEQITYNPTGAVVPGGLTNRTINAGEWFFATTGGGQQLIECLATTAAGYTITGTTDSKFAVRGDYAVCKTAARRYQGWLQKKLRVAGRAVLGDRFVSVYEHWLGDTPQDLANYLLYDNTWEGVDRFSPSFYCGQAVDYGTLTWHSKHTSDFAAFKAGYIARWQTTWAATLAHLISLKHEVPSILLAAGVPVDRLPRIGWLYEGGDHNTIKTVPSDQQAGLRTALIEVLKSAEGFAMVAQIWSDLEKYIGNSCEWFVDVEQTFYNTGIYPSGQMQSFGLREFQFNGPWNANGANEGRYNATVAAFA